MARNKTLLLLLVLLIPLGFSTKFYHGPAQVWVHGSLGGILYVMFWSLFFAYFSPSHYQRVCYLVFIVTSLLEVAQLWQPPILVALRSHFLGSALLGNTFVWSDFFYYLLGTVLSLLICKWLISS